jgi:hypothetical protein
VSNAIGYAMHYSRSADAVIRVYDAAGNVIETHEHKGDFREFCKHPSLLYRNRGTAALFTPSLGLTTDLSLADELRSGGLRRGSFWSEEVRASSAG